MEPKKPSVLRKFRKERGITINELSKGLNVSPAAICGMEYGKKPIGELWARRFAEFFGIEDWSQFLSEIEKK